MQIMLMQRCSRAPQSRDTSLRRWVRTGQQANPPLGALLLPCPTSTASSPPRAPLTLAAIARGAQPLVLADLARAAKTPRGVHRARRSGDARDQRTAAFFAPELEVIEFPAWDCLPYDRASPALSVSARRLAALHRLAGRQLKARPQLLVTTINALLQRAVTPFRIRESVRLLKPGMEISRESLTGLLQRQGYSRTDTVADAGEFAVRGSIFDIFPSGLEQGLRLDFFGDELETLRLFDPNTQRSTGSVDEHLLLPASEALLDEDSVKRFRSRYREQFGANATSDPLYQAVSDGRRLAGMEHWLPLFEERLTTLFDHLGSDDLIVIDNPALGAADERLTDIADYFATRSDTSGKAAGSYRPLDPAALYLDRARAGRPAVRLADPPRRHLRPARKRSGHRLRLHQRPRFCARTRARRQCL